MLMCSKFGLSACGMSSTEACASHALGSSPDAGACSAASVQCCHAPTSQRGSHFGHPHLECSQPAFAAKKGASSPTNCPRAAMCLPAQMTLRLRSAWHVLYPCSLSCCPCCITPGSTRVPSMKICHQPGAPRSSDSVEDQEAAVSA